MNFLLLMIFLSFSSGIRSSNYESTFEVLKGSFENDYLIPNFDAARTVFSSSAHPGGRQSGCVILRQSSLFVFGGSGYNSLWNYTRLNDVWEFDLDETSETYLKWRFWKGSADSGPRSLENENSFDSRNEMGGWSHGLCFYDPITDIAYFTLGLVTTDEDDGFVHSNSVWGFRFLDKNWKQMLPRSPINFGETGQFGADVFPPPYKSWTMIGMGIENEQTLMWFGGYIEQNASDIRNLSSSRWAYQKGSSNDLWEYSSKNNQFRHVFGPQNTTAVPNGVYNEKGVKNSTSIPPRRRSHSTFYSKQSNCFYVFGGNDVDNWFLYGDYSLFYNDLWCWNRDDEVWIWLSGNAGGYEGDAPGGLSYEDFVYSSWNAPPSGSGFSFWVTNDDYIQVFGGHRWALDTGQVDYTSLWMYSSSLDEWKFSYGFHGEYIETNFTKQQPGSRDNSMIAYDSEEQIFYLFGGSCYDEHSYDLFCNDVWKISSFDCFNVAFYEEEEVCSGHGTCIESDTCICEEEYTEKEDCSLEEKSIPLVLIATISGAVVVTCFVALIVCALILVVFIIIIIGGSGSFVIFKQSKQLKQFDDIGGKILLHEELGEGENRKTTTTTIKFKINEALFEVKFEDIKLTKRLGGGGSQSNVFLGNWKGRVIAIKIFKTTLFETQEYFEEFEKEISIVSGIHHPSIVQCFGATFKRNRCGILFEYCENGSLRSFLMLHPKKLELKARIRILIEIASGLEYLHDRKIIHRDIKPDNILLKSNLESKITDFGISKISADSQRLQTARLGTSQYMSPEIVQTNSYTHKVDIFSLSILMFELFTENFFPYGKQTTNIEIKVANNPSFRPEFPKKIVDESEEENEEEKEEIKVEKEEEEEEEEKEILPKYLISLIKSCWNHDASQRPEASDIIKILEEKEFKVSTTTS